MRYIITWMRPRLEFESKFAVPATEACIQNAWDDMDWYFDSSNTLNSKVSYGYPSFNLLNPAQGTIAMKRRKVIDDIAMKIPYSTTLYNTVGIWMPIRGISAHDTSTTSMKYSYGYRQWRRKKNGSGASLQDPPGSSAYPGYLLVLVQLPKSNITVVNSSNSEIMISPK